MATYKITQTETHFTESETHEEALRRWNAGELDGSGRLETQVEKIEDPQTRLKTYTILSGTIYEIPATSKDEAMEKLSDGVADGMFEGEALSDFYGSQPCEECSSEWGWHKNDEAGITFEGLKKAQNEAILLGIKYAMDYLEDINYHDGANVLQEYWAFMSDPESVKMPDWQSVFHAGHSLYSTECEG
jgi:hypothetical protein